MSIRSNILVYLYNCVFVVDEYEALDDLCKNHDWDHDEYVAVVNDLEHQGLIETRTLGRHSKLLLDGIRYVEANNLVPAKSIQDNDTARVQILKSLVKHREARGDLEPCSMGQILKDVKCGGRCVRQNVYFLEELGFVEFPGAQCARITEDGLEALNQYERLANRIKEFEGLENINPLKRGRLFEILLANTIEEEGWKVKHSVRTSNEEMDLVIIGDSSVYIVEAKWTKRPTETKVVRDFIAKVRDRAGARGVVFSMSGYAAGAVKYVESQIGETTVFLFGPEDVSEIIYDRSELGALLEAKHEDLILSKRATWK